ncbi:hypothetical protein V8F33_012632 [Rhypophila sp. PSN 637]
MYSAGGWRDHSLQAISSFYISLPFWWVGGSDQLPRIYAPWANQLSLPCSPPLNLEPGSKNPFQARDPAPKTVADRWCSQTDIPLDNCDAEFLFLISNLEHRPSSSRPMAWDMRFVAHSFDLSASSSSGIDSVLPSRQPTDPQTPSRSQPQPPSRTAGGREEAVRVWVPRFFCLRLLLPCVNELDDYSQPRRRGDCLAPWANKLSLPFPFFFAGGRPSGQSPAFEPDSNNTITGRDPAPKTVADRACNVRVVGGTTVFVNIANTDIQMHHGDHDGTHYLGRAGWTLRPAPELAFAPLEHPDKSSQSSFQLSSMATYVQALTAHRISLVGREGDGTLRLGLVLTSISKAKSHLLIPCSSCSLTNFISAGRWGGRLGNEVAIQLDNCGAQLRAMPISISNLFSDRTFCDVSGENHYISGLTSSATKCAVSDAKTRATSKTTTEHLGGWAGNEGPVISPWSDEERAPKHLGWWAGNMRIPVISPVEGGWANQVSIQAVEVRGDLARGGWAGIRGQGTRAARYP